MIKLEAETRKAIRKMEDGQAATLMKLWRHTKRDMELVVMEMYRRDFGRASWDIVSATRNSTLYHIHLQISHLLGKFRDEATEHIKQSLREQRREETLRSAWTLDQITPPSYKSKIPHKAMESDSPRDYIANWIQTLETWIASYHDLLASNLRLEALHEGSINDAADEIDATTIGGSDPESKLYSLFSTESIKIQQDARTDFADANDEAVAEEVFLTLEDGRVCPICDEYDGRPVDDVETPPVHFNCRCYTSIVPEDWAQMLANGSEEEKATALQIEDQGLVPSTIAIRGEDGELEAVGTVSFDSWKDNEPLSVVGGI